MEKIWQEIERLLISKGRVIANIKGNGNGPAIAFCAGVHGNEPTGVLALNNVFSYIRKHDIPVDGKLIAFIGNRNALHNKIRFAQQDLNRMWSMENINKLHNGGFRQEKLHPEKIEMTEINDLLQDFLEGVNNREKYFIDLHTTSSPSIPFAAIDKQRESYEFALQLPIPFVANLDDFVKGTLLYYLDHISFKAVVFEAGMHDDPRSVLKHEALIWLVLGLSGAVKQQYIPNYEGCFTLLQGLSDHPHKVFNILHRHNVVDNAKFAMQPGFINFQTIHKGEVLARENGKSLKAAFGGNIFMPLYQSQGADGFFIIERTDTI
jgi:succinylglutamate desuccinylase